MNRKKFAVYSVPLIAIIAVSSFVAAAESYRTQFSGDETAMWNSALVAVICMIALSVFEYKRLRDAGYTGLSVICNILPIPIALSGSESFGSLILGALPAWVLFRCFFTQTGTGVSILVRRDKKSTQS